MRVIRFFPVVLFSLCVMASAFALDPSMRRSLADTKAPVHLRRCLPQDSDSVARSPYKPAMLQIANDEVIDTLLNMGCVIYNRRCDILLASVPRDSAEKIVKLKSIRNSAASIDISSCMDMARNMCGVDAVHSGFAPLPQPYDGSGVVVGFSDIGFDPNHIAFKDRVMEVHNYNTRYAVHASAVSPEDIALWTTDTIDNFHATHVANILAGGYKGNDYYGVATGSKIIATTSDLNDVGILAGVEDIIAYAKSVGQPAVINLSLSSNLGPHDGSDLFSQYISYCANDAVICISAGNQGKVNGYACHELSPENPIGRLTVNNLPNADGFDVDGYADFWSPDNTSFSFRFEVYDFDAKDIVYASEWFANSCADDTLIIKSDEVPEIAQFMTGKWHAESGISDLNGRFCVTVHLDTHTSLQSDMGAWGKYYTCLAVRMNDRPVRIDAFSDANSSSFGRYPGTDTFIGADGSINNMCTASGIISVGNCISRNAAPRLFTDGADSGTTFGWNVTPGCVSKTTSYSNVPTIAPLPHFCAPGTYVVSAASGPFINDNTDLPVSAVENIDGNTYYWFPQMGTSMSSPFAAGVIALWLQADPTLSSKEILDIATSTASTDFSDINDPRWGAGCIDALAGLKLIIKKAGVIDASSIQPLVTVNPDRRLEITVPDGTYPLISLHTLSGQRIDHTAALAPGIYILQIGSHTQKLLVK